MICIVNINISEFVKEALLFVTQYLNI